MKLIPVDVLIRGKRLLLIDDSIVRGTQLGETTEFLYQSGGEGGTHPPGLPAPALWLPLPELLSLLLGAGSHHPADHP